MRRTRVEYAASSFDNVDLCLLRETFWAITVVRIVEWETSCSLRRGVVRSLMVDRRALRLDCRSRTSGTAWREGSERRLLRESEGSLRMDMRRSRMRAESARSPDMALSQSLDQGVLLLLEREVWIVWSVTMALWRS